MAIEKGPLVQGLTLVQTLMGKDAPVCFFPEGMYSCSHELSVLIPYESELECVVAVGRLLSVLQAFPDEEIEFGLSKNANQVEIALPNGKRKAGIAVIEMADDAVEQSEVLRKSVEDGMEWAELEEKTRKALVNASGTASDDTGTFEFSCVHITPKFIEACDNHRFYRCDSGLGEGEFCVPRKSVEQLEKLGVSEYSFDGEVLRFKTGEGVILFCRAYESEYPDLSALAEFETKLITFPKGFADCIERTAKAVAGLRNALIKLDSKIVRVRGEDAGIWYEEIQRVKYDGDDLTFTANPSVLSYLLSRENKIGTDGRKMRIETDDEVYSICIVPKEGD